MLLSVYGKITVFCITFATCELYDLLAENCKVYMRHKIQRLYVSPIWIQCANVSVVKPFLNCRFGLHVKDSLHTAFETIEPSQLAASFGTYQLVKSVFWACLCLPLCAVHIASSKILLESAKRAVPYDEDMNILNSIKRLKLHVAVSWVTLNIAYMATPSDDSPHLFATLLRWFYPPPPTTAFDIAAEAFRNSVRSPFGYFGFSVCVELVTRVICSAIDWLVGVVPIDGIGLGDIGFMLFMGLTNLFGPNSPSSAAEYWMLQCLSFFAPMKVYAAIGATLEDHTQRGTWKQIKAFIVVVFISLTAPTVTWAIYGQSGGDVELSLWSTLFSWNLFPLAGAHLVQYVVYDILAPLFWMNQKQRTAVAKVKYTPMWMYNMTRLRAVIWASLYANMISEVCQAHYIVVSCVVSQHDSVGYH